MFWRGSFDWKDGVVSMPQGWTGGPGLPFNRSLNLLPGEFI